MFSYKKAFPQHILSPDHSLNEKTTLKRIVSLNYQTRPRTSFKNLEKETAPLMIRTPPIHSVAERKPSTPPMINKIDGSIRSC